MRSIQTEIEFIKDFDNLLTHARNLELMSAVGELSTKQMLEELRGISKKAEEPLDALRENKEDAGDEQGQASTRARVNLRGRRAPVVR